MAQLIIGVVCNVLRHVAIQILKSQSVGWISSYEALEFFARLSCSATGRSDSAEFRVLGPQITLDKFSPECELKKRNIALREFALA